MKDIQTQLAESHRVSVGKEILQASFSIPNIQIKEIICEKMGIAI